MWRTFRVRFVAAGFAVLGSAQSGALASENSPARAYEDPLIIDELAGVGEGHPLVRAVLAANPDLDVVICLAGCMKHPGQVVYARPKPTATLPESTRPAEPAAPTAQPLPNERAWVAPAVATALAGALMDRTRPGAPTLAAAAGADAASPARVWVSPVAALELFRTTAPDGARVGYIRLAAR